MFDGGGYGVIWGFGGAGGIAAAGGFGGMVVNGNTGGVIGMEAVLLEQGDGVIGH